MTPAERRSRLTVFCHGVRGVAPFVRRLQQGEELDELEREEALAAAEVLLEAELPYIEALMGSSEIGLERVPAERDYDALVSSVRMLVASGALGPGTPGKEELPS